MTRKLALIFAVMLIAAACGGSGEPTADDAGAAPTAAPTDAPAAPATTDDHADDEAAHEDDAAADDHADDEAAHEDDAAADDHADDEAAHEDDATTDDHADDEAAHEDDHDVVEAGDADRVVEIVMTDFAFTPNPITVAEGETIRFMVRNEGVIEHELRVTTHHAAEEHVAAGHEGHNEGGGEDASGEGGHGHEEIILLVQPGESDMIDVTFHDAGDFDTIACLIPGHFEAGMKAPIEYATT
jgi:uncharacterized cupredoxin-like copper-binding protein